MIVTQMYKGQGLGNQLWCYVTTRVIAKDRGYHYGIMNPEIFKGINFINLDFGSPVTGGTGPEGGPPETLPKGIQHYYKERVIRHPVTGEDISTHDDNLISIPDNTKIDGNMQDENYILHRKKEIRAWLKVDPEYECFDYADDNTCVINFRGGEYTRVPRVFLPSSYWEQAVIQMKKINPKFRFIVITDDVVAAKKFFPDFEVLHFNVAKDYVIIKNAKYLIISNSSFAWFPAWLNEDLKYCIAPKYWWAHNLSDGYWACSFNLTRGWMYLDRSGKLHDYEACLKERDSYIKGHKDYFFPIKIKKNFLVVSSFNNDVSWVPLRTNNYVIYNRGTTPISYKIDKTKVITTPNIGYNLYDYFTFIIDNYDHLPERTIFTKGNVFPRHATESYFDQVSNSDIFRPIEDPSMHEPKRPSAFFSSGGEYHEINNSWYMKEYSKRYFSDYNDFLKFCFKNPILPKYVRFAPGACYIVPKDNILKLPKIFYQNLLEFISYTPLPGEAHIIERSLYTLWTSNFEINDRMLRPLNKKTVPVLITYRESKLEIATHTARMLVNKNNLKTSLKKHLPKRFKFVGKTTLSTVKVSVPKILALKNYLLFQKSSTKNGLSSPVALTASEYRKNIKVYDCFYFFSELDLLEIRLNILDPYVDYFVIVEATETFTGLPKKLVYEQHKDRFKKFAHKIIYHVTTDTPRDDEDLRLRLYDKNISALDKQMCSDALTSDNVPKGEVHWLKEFYQKESLKKALIGLSDDDFVFVSDVDEIWNPHVTIDFSRDDLYKYRQEAYYYYLNNRSDDDWETGWTGTVATKYQNIRKNCLNHLRTHSKNTYTVLKNGGWHFTFQGGADQIRKKLESYGHQEFNNDKIKSQIEEVLSKNTDYRGRKLRFWVDESKLPRYLLDNKDKYKKLFRSS